MTRKDYVMLAAALKSVQPQSFLVNEPWAHIAQHMRDVEALADALASDNPRFERQRFLTACGMR